jgi:hypothetical protein
MLLPYVLLGLSPPGVSDGLIGPYQGGVFRLHEVDVAKDVCDVAREARQPEVRDLLCINAVERVAPGAPYGKGLHSPLPGVRLVTWTIPAVISLCLRPYALLGSFTPGCQIGYTDDGPYCGCRR